MQPLASHRGVSRGGYGWFYEPHFLNDLWHATVRTALPRHLDQAGPGPIGFRIWPNHLRAGHHGMDSVPLGRFHVMMAGFKYCPTVSWQRKITQNAAGPVKQLEPSSIQFHRLLCLRLLRGSTLVPTWRLSRQANLAQLSGPNESH